MKIAIGSDHKGFEHKTFIIENLKKIQWVDVGCFSAERCDYPEFARKVVQKILEKEADLGVLLCGSGIGMVIAANRFNRMYAGLVWNQEVAKVAREDDNVNILILPTDFVAPDKSVDIIKSWLYAEFKGGVYQKRLEMIDKG